MLLCLPLFFVQISSLYSSLTIRSHTQFSRLNDFGFESQGFFNIKFESPTPIKVAVFLFPVERSSQVDLSKHTVTNFCQDFKNNNKNYDYFSNESCTFPEELLSHECTLTIKNTGVFIPIVFNCFRDIKVSYTLRNKKSFLDSREKFLPMFYIGLSFLSTTIVLVWLINAIINQKFLVKIHMLFTVSAALVAASLYLKANRWIMLTISDSNVLTSEVFCLLLEQLSLSFLFTINACASFGYGIYTQNYEYISDDAYRLFGTCFLICMIKMILSYVEEVYVYLILLVFAFNLGLEYIDAIWERIEVAYSLRNDIEDRDPSATLKLDLVLGFSSDLSVLLLSIFVVVFYNLIVSSHRSVNIVFQELFVFILLYVDGFYFLYRAAYEGTSLESVRASSPPEESEVLFINEPENSEFAFISHPQP